MSEKQKEYLNEIRRINAKESEVCNQIRNVIDALQTANDESLWLKGSYSIFGAVSNMMAFQEIIEELLEDLLKE